MEHEELTQRYLNLVAYSSLSTSFSDLKFKLLRDKFQDLTSKARQITRNLLRLELVRVLRQLTSQTIQTNYPAFYLSLANLRVSLRVLGGQNLSFKLEFKKHQVLTKHGKALDFSRARGIVDWFGDQIEHLQKLAAYYTQNIEKQCFGLTQAEITELECI